MKTNGMKLPDHSAVYMTDISSSETDETCGRRHWLSKFEAGHGIMKRDTLVSHLLDAEIHSDLRTLAQMEDISPPAIQDTINEVLSHLSSEDKLNVGKMELLYRRLGWFTAFALYHEPGLREAYETLPIDLAIVLDKNPFWPVAYPDRLLRDRKTGEVSYREYVPMEAGLIQERWLQSWHYNIRLHLGLAAAGAANTNPVMRPAYGQVMGMARGFRSALDNRLIHPYTWGYYNKATAEWASSTTGRDGTWDITPVWTFPGGLVAWVRSCGEATARSQFQLSPPVYLNNNMLDAWVARRLHREREIATFKTPALLNLHLRDIYFGKVTSECYPAQGDPCPYLKACWDKPTSQMPLQGGDYIPAPLGGPLMRVSNIKAVI